MMWQVRSRHWLVFVLVLFGGSNFSFASDPVLRVNSDLGTFFIQLFPDTTPITVENFLAYVNSGAYTQSVVHRTVPGFIVQSGGYVFQGGQTPLLQIQQNAPIQNEFNLSNLRGTLAMAKLGGDPNSATSEWFINLADNSANLDNQNGGFTVFGVVRGNGMAVVDTIAGLTRWNFGGAFTELPLIGYSGSGQTPTEEEFVLFSSIDPFVLIDPPLGAVLPGSRTIRDVDTAPVPATAFATLINPSDADAASCFVFPQTTLPISFSFQTTDPATNEPNGTINTPADIPAGGSQSFIISFTATSSFDPQVVNLTFSCGNSDAAVVLPGVNTISLGATGGSSADVVALAATVSNDGIVVAPNGGGESGVFAVASVNVGSAAEVVVSADTGNTQLPVNLFICQTDASGNCITNLDVTTTSTLAQDQTATYSIFAQVDGAITLDPATNRVFVRFRDLTGREVGSTSVALRTN